MAVLHELLAVEAGLAETATRISKEVTKVLDSKSSLFTGMYKAHSLLMKLTNTWFKHLRSKKSNLL